MINKDLYLIPISSCIATAGYNRATIYDFQLNELDFIPNAIFEIFSKCKHWQVKNILNKYGKENEEILMEYLDYLNINRYAYFGEKHEINLFPDFSLKWGFPSKISNAIIDIDNFETINYLELLEQLDNIHCFHLQLRFYQDVKNENKIEELIRFINQKSFHTLSIYLPFNVYNNFESCTQLINNNSKIDNITVYSAPKEDLIKLTEQWAFVNYTKNCFDVNSTCGYINTNFFSIFIEHFTESQFHNTCLNRKIGVDADGYIKNCPSMKANYGHISNTTLIEAIEKPGFKDYWFIKKDDIDVCQDCEFRHICTDCRAFIKNSNNIYSQPSKCGYNPYIAKWDTEEAWVSVEQWHSDNPKWEERAIEMREMNRKHLAR